MIGKDVHKFLKLGKADLPNVENYSIAVKSEEKWDIHHRAEILPCGRFSMADLKQHNLYWNRPASELIFLKHDEHISLHHKGKTQSAATRERIRKGVLEGKHPARNTYWWTDGKTNVRSRECPGPGWTNN